MFFNETPTAAEAGNKRKAELSVEDKVQVHNNEVGSYFVQITAINEANIGNLKVVTAENNSITICESTDEIWDANNNAWVAVSDIGADGITAQCWNDSTMLVKAEDYQDTSEQSCYSLTVADDETLGKGTGIYFDTILFKIK
tara:strand:+ start:502 stop:927 length:426 start_codon:yes stop_codon:yes gene_type:complete